MVKSEESDSLSRTRTRYHTELRRLARGRRKRGRAFGLTDHSNRLHDGEGSWSVGRSVGRSGRRSTGPQSGVQRRVIIKDDDGENRFKIKESGKTQQGSDVVRGGRDDKKRTSEGRGRGGRIWRFAKSAAGVTDG